MYVGNGTNKIHLSNFKPSQITTVYSDNELDRGEPIVEIGAYALMPNHVHFILREIRNHGTALFMQKVFTGYTMYFNKGHGRTGALFSGTFKSKHLENDRYLKRAIPYTLLNPVELLDPHWKSGNGLSSALEERILEYPYSSLHEFLGIERSQSKIVNADLRSYYDKIPTLKEMVIEAQEYYREHAQEEPRRLNLPE